MNGLIALVLRHAAARRVAAVVPPSFSAAGTIAVADYPGTTTNVPIPAGQSGKYAVVLLEGAVVGTDPTTPSGWVKILTKLNNTGGGTLRGTYFGRRLDGSEGATQAFVTAGGEGTVGVCMTFNDVNVATPYTLVGAGTSLASAGASTTTFNPPDGALAAGAALLVAVAVTCSVTCAITGGSGMTELIDMTTFSGGVFRRSIIAALKSSLVAATIDPGTWTYSSNTGYGVSLDVQLNPA